ncbi:MAG: OmpH family outer membrane protein [Crocinitomicaceae bacterium]|jgi:outer membrane protein|nr:OmpH family outer membrane protein [Crocinitomicaceae bacterium]MDG2465401.1 OmpH family outer membrane protein [Crocinitomicaceae bacterium]
MNKFLTLAAIALITLASCGDKKKEAKETTTAKVQEVKAGNLKMAFYYQDSLNANFTFLKEERTKLEAKQKSFQNEVDRLTREYQSYVERNSKKADRGEFAQVELQSIQQKAMSMQQKIGDYQQNKGGALEKEAFDKMEEISKKVEVYSQEFCEKNKISILMLHAKGGQFGYIKPDMDVTNDFIEFLNAKQDEIKKDMEK